MPIAVMRRYVCKKCGWKSRAQLMSDCFIPIRCPKCRAEAKITASAPSPLDMFRKKIFNDPSPFDGNPYPALLDWFGKKKKDF